MKAALTAEARRKDWQTVRNIIKTERTKPIEAIAITEDDDDAIDHGRKKYAIESTGHSETREHRLGQDLPEGGRRHKLTTS